MFNRLKTFFIRLFFGISTFPALLKRMTVRHVGWIHFKVALGFGWGSAILFNTPPTIKETIDESTIQLWAYGTIAGALISIVGILMTLSIHEHRKVWGLGVEVVGIVALGGGPLQYLSIQIAYLIDGEFDKRYALAWFAYAMLSAIIVRMILVVFPFVSAIRAIQEANQRMEEENNAYHANKISN